MAGTYIRCDRNCNAVTPQPKEVIVAQAVSGIEYEVFNNDYVRKSVDNGTTTQPDLLSGWNGDYIRVKTDGTKVTGLSKIFVEQSNYKKNSVNNTILPYQDYVRRDVNNNIITTRFINRYSTTESPVVILLATESDRDNIIMSENDIFRIELEANTTTVGLSLDNTQYITDENGNKQFTTENGEFITQQQ